MISAYVFQLSGKKNSLLISPHTDFYLYFFQKPANELEALS